MNALSRTSFSQPVDSSMSPEESENFPSIVVAQQERKDPACNPSLVISLAYICSYIYKMALPVLHGQRDMTS